jgi:hypothetical protein
MSRTIKTWRIFNWAPDDVVWLEEQGIRNRVVATNIPFAQGNKVAYMRGDVGLTCETDTAEQEMILRLKFEPSIVLMLEELVLDELRECTLSELRF